MGEALEPRESPGLRLWRATLSWQRQMTLTLKPLGLTHVQFVLVASTWWLNHVAGESPTQRRIADHANTDPMMTSQVLRTLTAKGLLSRTPDPTDSRAVLVEVTPTGAALAKRAVKLVEEADKTLLQNRARRQRPDGRTPRTKPVSHARAGKLLAMTDLAGADWFAVRCVFRLGRPAGVDGKGYEERITLWRADSFDHAIERAEAEALEYASMVADSPDEYLGLAQAYRLADVPGDGAEVFSLIRESKHRPQTYVDRFFDTGTERQGFS
ncbi:DNA-binding MarR family transcriptional regulator [Kribbella aluminosa]|uniref:DNA-binding MarR family transcriptional regulator n=1 Tax=Kribbella aluminosa TaxID=416017 RepID=A0ABS4UZI5_9ACTN|nr:winged helix DNA-binding protein [Kribbella aluminosa]MBP2357040.1 DNA-binding MarR family transcriptional regulator [Kribbella aluminosa]